MILTVPKEMATKLKRSLTGHEDNKHARVLIHKSAGSGVLVHFGGKLEGEVMVANLIDGTFPDWHRILPKNSTLREPCHPVAFNAGYMADLAECGMSGQKTPANVQIMTSEGANSPFCVRTNCPDFLGVMMPVRNKDRDSSEALPPLKWLVGKA